MKTLTRNSTILLGQPGFGQHVYGFGVMAIGLACLAFGNFDPGQPVSETFPARTALAYLAGAFLVLAGAALQWRGSRVWGAAALTSYYVLIVVLLMNGSQWLTEYAHYGIYESLSEQVAIAAAALIFFAASAQVLGIIDASIARNLTRLSQLAFGICALTWGGAHFVYMNLTAPLVPKWLPPTQEFWGYLTGVAFMAAGVAILTRVQARLAAILLTIMLATFALLIHEPMLLAAPSVHFNWTESAANLTLLGAAWVVADSLARPSR